MEEGPLRHIGCRAAIGERRAVEDCGSQSVTIIGVLQCWDGGGTCSCLQGWE